MNAILPTLTELEIDVLDGIYRSDYNDGGTTADIWAWSINARKATTKQLSGVVSSLSKKGIVVTDGDGTRDNDFTIRVTELGIEVARSLGFFTMYNGHEVFNDKHDSPTDSVSRCADCGKRGERTGHQDCQFPENH